MGPFTAISQCPLFNENKLVVRICRRWILFFLLSIFLQIGNQLALKTCPPPTNSVPQTVRIDVSYDEPNILTGAGSNWGTVDRREDGVIIGQLSSSGNYILAGGGLSGVRAVCHQVAGNIFDD